MVLVLLHIFLENILAAPAPDFFFQAAPAPDFFPQRLRLLVFFLSGSGSNGPKTPGSGSFAKYSFPRKLVR